jgi:hypothetical protein
MNVPLYKRAESKLDKMILIKHVTEQVIDHGRVRFLRQQSGKNDDVWVGVSFRTAQDKVSHALRDGISKPVTIKAEEIVNDVRSSSIQRIVASEKKRIDPLALLAATSQLKTKLPANDRTEVDDEADSKHSSLPMDKGAVHQSEMPQVNGVDECRD